MNAAEQTAIADAIRFAIRLASSDRDLDPDRRCRSFTAYLAGVLENYDPLLAADVRALLSKEVSYD